MPSLPGARQSASGHRADPRFRRHLALTRLGVDGAQQRRHIRCCQLIVGYGQVQDHVARISGA